MGVKIKKGVTLSNDSLRSLRYLKKNKKLILTYSKRYEHHCRLVTRVDALCIYLSFFFFF